MNKDDQLKIAKLYEEGFWDRFKAGASGITAGAKSLISGQGYAQANQSAKLTSLMSGSLNSILKDIKKIEGDMLKYSNDPSQQSYVAKINQIKNIIVQNTK